jgi:hypothetical protein
MAWSPAPGCHLSRTQGIASNGRPKWNRKSCRFPVIPAKKNGPRQPVSQLFLTEGQKRRSGISVDDILIESLMEMDVVLYKRTAISRGSKDTNSASVPVEVGAIQENGSLAPLCAWSTENAFAPIDGDDPDTGGSIEFLVDEERAPYDTTNNVIITELLPTDVIGYGSRQVGGGKGPGNPHGEESEQLYYIEKRVLEEMGVIIEVRPELEILW